MRGSCQSLMQKINKEKENIRRLARAAVPALEFYL
jgi:hypothetical protein